MSLSLAMFASNALACAPAPSCWMKYGPTYLKSICSGYAKDKKTLQEIATYLDEPEKVDELSSACRKLGVALREK